MLVSASDPFDGALRRAEELREFYDGAMEAAVRKDIGHLDEMCRRLIAASPMLFVATYSEQGQCDVSPRGGQPGFVTVIGVGLAAAILIDVLVVRMIVAPAVIALLGDRAWGLPGWLDRVLPRISLEGDEHRPVPQPG